MDKKTFTPRGFPQASKPNHDSSKPDFTRKKNVQIGRKKELDRIEKTTPNRGRTGQRNVRSREKVGAQVNSSSWEVGSIQKSGNKKHRDITHQLVYPEYHPQHTRQHAIQAKRAKFSSAFSKEHYLQANCQFVVSLGHNYSEYENDPDQLVEWNLIEEVWLHRIDPPDCPICLFPPAAAKITKCGHIYCYSCILHYLALSDSKWRTCPICQEYIQRDTLKSMIVIKRKDYAIGEEIEMKLMKRDRDSIIPIPVYSSTLPTSKPYSSFKRCYTNHKLIIADADEVDKHIIMRELDELMLKRKTDGDVPESCFIDEALAAVETRKLNLLKSSSLAISDQLNSLNLSGGAMALEYDSGKPDQFKTMHMQNAGQIINTTAKQTYYFYQATTGSYTYMHSLNIQMLTKEFGSLENCPPTIKGTVIEKESLLMTSDSRQRFRCLKHLPLSCSVDIMELHFTEPILSAVTLCELKGQIESRERKRKQREREVNKIDQRVRLQENKMLGITENWADIHLESRAQFPDFSHEPSLVSEAGIEQETEATDIANTNWNVTSFAQMAKNSKTKSTASPEPHLQWPSLPVQSPPQHSDEEDHAYMVPAYNDTFLSGVLSCSRKQTQPDNKKGQNKNKNKKKKRNLLFSMGGQKI